MAERARSDRDGQVTVAIATLGARVHQITLPAPHPDLEYLITVQRAQDDRRSDWTDRSDVRIVRTETTGLSENRNFGLDLSKGDFVLFSDDDIKLETEGILRLRQALMERPGVSLAAGWRVGRRPNAGPRSGVHSLGLMNSGRVCAPEFMIRTKPVRDMNLRFDNQFGVGARFPIGEDYVFVTDVLKAGLKGISVPVEVGRHDGASSGDDWSNPQLMQARQMLLRRVFGRYAFPVRLAYTWRHRRRFRTPTECLRFLAGESK